MDLDDAMFGIEPNIAVMHQVVTAQLAARRSGTQSTKTRAEVRGGGAKPWKQKGTGRARAGSSRSPIWTGGGVIHAPKPACYAQRTPKKMIRLALKSALSDRAASERVLVARLGPRRPEHQGRHRRPRRQRRRGQGPRRAPARGRGVWKSFRNLDHVHICGEGELNAYDVLVSDWVVFTPDTLPVDRPVTRGDHVTEEAS